MARLSDRALGRAVLARQWLLAPRAASVATALEHVVGLQAQAPRTPYFALSARLAGFTPGRLAKLIESGRAVRLPLLRSTLHLTTRRDAAWQWAVLQPTLERLFDTGPFARGVRGVERPELVREALGTLRDGPATLDALGARLARRWPKADARALGQAVRQLVPVYQPPPRGVWGRTGEARFGWFDEPPRGRPELSRLVTRYLAAFGPATVADAQAWSGVRALAPVFDALRKRLVTFEDAAGRELFDLPRAPRPGDRAPAPPRLLGEFDQLLLAYRDRRRFLDPSLKSRVFTANGTLRGLVLIDGIVTGTWTLDDARAAVFAWFEPPPRKYARALAEERRRVETLARS